MSRVETWVYQDLNEAVKINHICGVVFSADNEGNLVGVRVYKNGAPVELSGSCIGYCTLANGMTVPVSGTVVSNKAYIVLPSTVYAVPGPISIVIKNIDGSAVTTLAAVISMVYGVGDTIPDPSQETIDMWTAQINAAIAAVSGNSVRYDTSQSLTTAQKQQAQENIGATLTVVNTSGDNYKLIMT